MSTAVARTIETSTHGRFLIEPGAGQSSPLLLVGFHGYGENAERHLEELRRIPGSERWTRVSVQGLYRFYTGKFQDVVACWMTREDRELAIADNISYINRVIAMVTSEIGAPARLVYVGFSQGAAMAFRAAVLGASPADGIVALGGDVPPELWENREVRFPKVLLGRGQDDPWYTDEKLQADADRLRARDVSVEVVTFVGGHEWSEQFRHATAQFLRSLTVP